jgi:hypothetical protein
VFNFVLINSWQRGEIMKENSHGITERKSWELPFPEADIEQK